ncbi:MAG: hypothetical protein WAM62_07690 [Pseudolabrys sp.]
MKSSKSAGVSTAHRIALSVRAWYSRWTKADVFTFAIAAFTCIQVWAFIESERAFLSVIGARNGPADILTADKPVAIAMTIKNSGRSTAIVDDFNMTVTIHDPLPVVPKYETLNELRFSAIEAGAESPGTYRAPTTLTNDEISAIKRGDAQFHMFGFVRYHDAFSILGGRVTAFCIVYDPRPGPPGSEFTICPERAYTHTD